jgi:hypothetical protein
MMLRDASQTGWSRALSHLDEVPTTAHIPLARIARRSDGDGYNDAVYRRLGCVMLTTGCLSRPGSSTADAPAIVQIESLTFNATPGMLSTWDAALSAPVGQGHLVVAAVVAQSASTLDGLMVSDTEGRSWQIGATQSCVGTKLALAYTADTTEGMEAVRVMTTSSNSHLGLALFEMAGVASFEGGVGGCASGQTSSTMTTPELQTTTRVLLFALFADTVGSGAIIPDAPWQVEDSNSSFFYLAAGDDGVDHAGQPPGTYHAAASDPNPSTTWASLIGALGVR